jgi:hypothetical protein
MSATEIRCRLCDAPPPKSGQQQGDHEHDREQGEEREATSSTRGAHLSTFDAPPPVGA